MPEQWSAVYLYFQVVPWGIGVVSKECQDSGLQFTFTFRLYYGVRIVGVVCKESLEHRLQFDVSRLGKVQWQSSKRFIRGALLCLTRDNFATRYFATVSDRDKKDLEQGIVQVGILACRLLASDKSSRDTVLPRTHK